MPALLQYIAIAPGLPVLARALLRLAWHARGEGLAKNTPADRMARFQQLLSAAFEEARTAATPVPHDPAPWVTAARGLVLPHEGSAAPSRAPFPSPAATPSPNWTPSAPRWSPCPPTTPAHPWSATASPPPSPWPERAPRPWTHHANPVVAYGRARALAIVKAGKRRAAARGHVPGRGGPHGGASRRPGRARGDGRGADRAAWAGEDTFPIKRTDDPRRWLP
ncbi:hypothetical protein GCM10010421_40360 [Streptomyces glaucus]|uniref:Uncharacterized protein n=1 Tax=Streptomyces glaucus TaxID=284029 RepID=A0ABN3K2M7_9ACTN